MRFWLLRKLLKWYCEYELDQWDFFRVHTKHGEVFIDISRMPQGPKEMYNEL